MPYWPTAASSCSPSEQMRLRLPLDSETPPEMFLDSTSRHEHRANAYALLTQNSDHYLLDFNDGKLEKLMPNGSTMRIEHFDPATKTTPHENIPPGSPVFI